MHCRDALSWICLPHALQGCTQLHAATCTAGMHGRDALSWSCLPHALQGCTQLELSQHVCSSRKDRAGYDIPTLLQLTQLDSLRYWAAGDTRTGGRLDCRQLKVGGTPQPSIRAPLVVRRASFVLGGTVPCPCMLWSAERRSGKSGLWLLLHPRGCLPAQPRHMPVCQPSHGTCLYASPATAHACMPAQPRHTPVCQPSCGTRLYASPAAAHAGMPAQLRHLPVCQPSRGTCLYASPAALHACMPARPRHTPVCQPSHGTCLYASPAAAHACMPAQPRHTPVCQPSRGTCLYATGCLHRQASLTLQAVCTGKLHSLCRLSAQAVCAGCPQHAHAWRCLRMITHHCRQQVVCQLCHSGRPLHVAEPVRQPCHTVQ